MDVNGIAGSIELYLGRDVLTVGDGSLREVQWTGYDHGLRQYQGEVLGKSDIHSAFESKLRRGKEVPNSIDSQDWEGVRLILSAIFGAFHETDAIEIIAWDAFQAEYAY